MVHITDTDFTDKDSCLLRAVVRRPSSRSERDKSGACPASRGVHPIRALCLLSGGLDSQLAIRLLLAQGIEVHSPQALRTLAVLPATPDMVESWRI